MRRALLLCLLVLSILPVAPARAQVTPGTLIIAGKHYLPGDDRIGNPFPLITQLEMTKTGGLLIRNWEPGLFDCQGSNRDNCHSVVSDKRISSTNNGVCDKNCSDPLFTSWSDISKSPLVPPFDVGTLDIEGALKVGTTYRFHCTVHGVYNASTRAWSGMVGFVTVVG